MEQLATRRNVRDVSRPKSSKPSSRSRERLPSAVVYGSLEDGMMICLGLLADEPHRFEPAAVAWHARWCASLPGVPFAESRAALCALEALMGSEPSAGALALSEVCRRYGVEDVASVLDRWLKGHSAPVAELPLAPARQNPTAA